MAYVAIVVLAAVVTMSIIIPVIVVGMLEPTEPPVYAITPTITATTVSTIVVTTVSTIVGTTNVVTPLCLPCGKNVVNFTVEANCLKITSDTIDPCRRTIQTITFTAPVMLETIDDYAFKLSPLTELVIPSSVRTIGKAAFTGTKLASILIPATVVAVRVAAFGLNQQLVAVRINNAVIGGEMFASCFNLTIVYISANTTTIELDAFKEDTKVRLIFASLTMPMECPTYGLNVIQCVREAN